MHIIMKTLINLNDDSTKIVLDRTCISIGANNNAKKITMDFYIKNKNLEQEIESLKQQNNSKNDTKIKNDVLRDIMKQQIELNNSKNDAKIENDIENDIDNDTIFVNLQGEINNEKDRLQEENEKLRLQEENENLRNMLKQKL
jgi:hypothetical protein